MGEIRPGPAEADPAVDNCRMNWGELFGGLAILAVGGWLVALIVASLLRGGQEAAMTAAFTAESIVFGGGGLLLFFVIGFWLVVDAF